MRKINISPENSIKTYDGIFKGWGTSLCWWANRVGHSKKLCEDAADLFFDKEKGLGLNIMRYNIGGGDDPTHNHITRTDSMMPGFLSKDGSWDYTADERQLNILEKCYKAAGNDAFVEVFSNSPPYFMTVSGCSSGHLIPVFTNLKRKCTDDFADYLAHVTDYLQKEKGIKVGSLAPMNEPFTPYWRKNSEKQEGCHVSPGRRQSELLIAVKKAMLKYGLTDVDLTASDETNTKCAEKAFSKLSKKALEVVDRISTHTYQDATPGIGNKCREKGFDLWMTETDWSKVRGEEPGEMGPALWFSHKIIEDMNVLQPSAWVIWQIVASYISKDGYLGRKDMDKMFDLNEGFWGCAVAEIDKEEYILTQKYYAFGQFSRYIRPGMKIILVDSNTIAAFNPESKELVIVAVNECKAEEAVQFNLKGFSSYSAAQCIRTSGDSNTGEKWAELPPLKITDNTLETTLKGNSVTTFILSWRV